MSWSIGLDCEGEIMKKQFKLIGRLFINGVEIASVIYLLLLAAGAQSNFPTVKNILSIMIMGGLIGIFSGIFSLDDIRIELPIHFVITFLAVLAMMAINNWVLWSNMTFWLGFILEYVIIYAIAWFIVFLSGNVKINRINKKLKERQKAQNK
ncbi:hypothetical protein FD05_GL002210 [Lentilactobacillus otakiensis DSM 19908 = JCM 15040]|nr:hypothetical protein FD05_GL002210 [Lentilactobacillus otakiensis DSM 19908 = JCM 15040]